MHRNTRGRAGARRGALKRCRRTSAHARMRARRTFTTESPKIVISSCERHRPVPPSDQVTTVVRAAQRAELERGNGRDRRLIDFVLVYGVLGRPT